MDTYPLANVASQSKPGQETKSPNLQGLSKKAQKRAAKAVRLHELKLERRAREKEAKKHKRRERALAIARGEFDEDGDTSRKRRKPSASTIFHARVAIDLGFDELMSDKEVNSLTSQLAYTYSANRHATHAFSVLLFTSFSGRTKQRMDAINDAGYRRWSRTEWWEEGYDLLWAGPSQHPRSPTDETFAHGSPAMHARADRETIVYLTADSSEELLELSEGETYIIGGICDHNRYKNLCLNKALSSQIRHARLPIGRYISLATRKVLTINQVFEILLKWIETRNWEEAFWAVIPKRKFQGRVKGSSTELGDDGGGHTIGTDDSSEIETLAKEVEMRELTDLRTTVEDT